MMKLLSKAIALSAFAALAACGGGSDKADNVEAAAENQSDALEMEADNLTAEADNATGGVADSLENQAAALDNQAAATEQRGENQAEAIQEAETNGM
jgi:hypothetical protein